MPSSTREAITLPSERQALRRLRWRWWLVALGSAVTLLLAACLLQRVWPFATRWLLLASLAAAYQLFLLRQNLPLNRRPGETRLLPRFGPGNYLTLFRGLMLAFLAGFLFSPSPAAPLAWLPALLYTAAVIADFLDGYLARRTNHATRLGEQIDIAFDSLGVLVVSLLAVWYGKLPPLYLLVGLARYLFLAGIGWRRRRVLPLFPLPPSVHRRIFAGFQMGFLAVVLWPLIPRAGATIAGLIFGTAVAAGFIRDWGLVIGALDPATPGYRRWQRRGYRLLARYLPLLLRLILLAVIPALLLSRGSPGPSALHPWPLPLPGIFAHTLFLITLFATATIALAFAPRLAALALLFPLGFDLLTRGPLFLNAIALAATIFILLFGGGLASLWQPEERYLYRPLGE